VPAKLFFACSGRHPDLTPKPRPDLSVTTAQGAWFATLGSSLVVGPRPGLLHSDAPAGHRPKSRRSDDHRGQFQSFFCQVIASKGSCFPSEPHMPDPSLNALDQRLDAITRQPSPAKFHLRRRDRATAQQYGPATIRRHAPTWST
jgi:hypothetical protein